MKKKIEQQIKKADRYARSILMDESENSELSVEEKSALESVHDGSYETERDGQIQAYNRKRNWQKIEKQVKGTKKLPIYRTIKFWHSTAAVLLIFILVVGAYMVFDDIRTNTPELVQPGTSIAYLEVDGSELIDLSQKDTLVMFDKVNAKIDSGKITYTSSNKKLTSNEYHKINVPRNGEYYVMLSDGTKVWINSESTIGFYSHYSSDKRILDLQGEAYFEVAKDSLRPFIVRTNNMDVRVLGTHFNVKAYADEDYTYTTLSEGEVRLIIDEERIEMKPDQQVILNNVNRKHEKKEIDASIYTAWKDGMFIFRDEPLENIMMALSRWYDVEIFYPNQNIKKELFSMRVDRYDDIEVLLGKMEKTGALSFSLNKKALIVE